MTTLTRPLAIGLQIALVAAVVLLGTTPAAAAGDTYVIDKTHSTVLFKLKHLNLSWAFGRFNDFNGHFHFDKADPSKSTVEVDISAESIDTALEDRDKHLRAPDFLNVEKYPSIGFKSTKCVKGTGNSYNVTGDFSMHGVTKEITIRMDYVGEGQSPYGYRMGFIGSVTIKRSDFGVGKSTPAAVVGDEIHITLSVEGIKKEAKKK